MPVFDIRKHNKTAADFEPHEITNTVNDLGRFTVRRTIATRGDVIYFLSEEVIDNDGDFAEKAKKYVVVFVFTPDLQKVWLITKQSPQWQKGLLNGIGGKVEEGEGYQSAALREVEEESGYCGGYFQFVGEMEGVNNDESNFVVKVFADVTNEELRTQEAEQVRLYRVADLQDLPTVGNVKALVELCRYRLGSTSHFGAFRMEYNSAKGVQMAKQRPFTLSDEHEALGIKAFNKVLNGAIVEAVECPNAHCIGGRHESGDTCKTCRGAGYLTRGSTGKEALTNETYAFISSVCEKIYTNNSAEAKEDGVGSLRESISNFLFSQGKGVSYAQRGDFVKAVARGYTDYKQHLLLECKEPEDFKSLAKNITDFFVMEFQQFMLEMG